MAARTSLFFFYCGDFVEAALVAATQVARGQEDLNHFDGGFAGNDAAAKGEDIGVIVLPCSKSGVIVYDEAAVAQAWAFDSLEGQ